MSEIRRFNPLDPAFLADPYPEYRRLRETDPVHWSVTGSWVVTRHDDAKAVLNDARYRTIDTPERIIERGQRYERSGQNLDQLNQFLRGFFLFSNPPEHGPMRSPARSAFTTVTPAALSQLVSEIVAELIAALEGKAEADLVAEFTEPLACRTIGRIMGIGDADSARIQQLCHQVARVLDSWLPLEEYRTLNEAAGGLLAAFESALARPGPGFLGGLAAATTEPDARAKLPAIAATIFFAGQETTLHALANSIFVLAGIERPSELLDAAPAGSSWVQELIRFESPVQLIAREALVDLELRGRSIKAGQRVVLYVGAANRDPEVFADPDRLDLARDARGHLAFSAGGHRCLGAHFAAEEMSQGLTALFGRFPGLKPVHATARRQKNVTIRGHAELKVLLRR